MAKEVCSAQGLGIIKNSQKPFQEIVILRCQGQTGFLKIKNKLKNVVCGPDINMSYNVITSKQDSEKTAETGTLFKGQQ